METAQIIDEMQSFDDVKDELHKNIIACKGKKKIMHKKWEDAALEGTTFIMRNLIIGWEIWDWQSITRNSVQSIRV